SAVDAVSGAVSVTNDAPATFALGATTVTFRAVDPSGNTVTGKATLTVVAGQAPFQPPVDRIPPHDVRNVTFTVSDGPVTLHWLQYPRATYYNVQLFRNGRKVLTAWPSTNRLTLTSSWLFAKTVVKFGPGRYTWFVWPGLGLVKDRHYGELLGQSWFVVK